MMNPWIPLAIASILFLVFVLAKACSSDNGLLFCAWAY